MRRSNSVAGAGEAGGAACSDTRPGVIGGVRGVGTRSASRLVIHFTIHAARRSEMPNKGSFRS